jgi:hypothetical protein
MKRPETTNTPRLTNGHGVFLLFAAAGRHAVEARREAVGSDSVNLTIEEIALLEFVYDQVGRDTRENVHVPPGATGSTEATLGLARRLVDAGFLRFTSLAADVNITQLGLEVVDELRSRRSDRPARAAALRLALVQWLYGHYADGTTPQITEDFLTSDRSYYAGQAFSANELTQAVVYLIERALVEGNSIDQTVHLVHPRLTAKGVDCAESGRPVSDFLNRPQISSGPTFHVKIDGSQNVTVGTQSNFTQNSTSGIDPAVLAQLTHFATVARQSLPGSGLDDQQQVVAEQLSQELEAEAIGEAPDQGRLRRLGNRLVEALAPAAGTALGGMVTALGQQAITAISG